MSAVTFRFGDGNVLVNLARSRISGESHKYAVLVRTAPTPGLPGEIYCGVIGPPEVVFACRSKKDARRIEAALLGLGTKKIQKKRKARKP